VTRALHALPDDLDRAAEKFLYREARLLDAGDFAGWLALFAADGVYWVPSRSDQTDPRTVPSIVYEDRALLEIRIGRLSHPHVYAASPRPRTTHVVGNVEILHRDEAARTCEVEAAFVMTEYRDDARRMFSGRTRHTLAHDRDGFRIALKRVDLVDCDGVHRPIVVPF
jgi:benzoate/toluate 1,2-dioxygenase subunit beta